MPLLSSQRRPVSGLGSSAWFAPRFALAFLLWLALTAAGAWFLVFRPAEELDLKAAEHEADICESFLATEMERLRAVSLDWANWDDLEKYLLDPEDKFAVENVTQVALRNLDIDGMLLVKKDGQLQRREVTGPNKSLYPGSNVFLERTAPLRSLALQEGASVSVLGGAGHIFVVAVAPVLGTDAAGPASGEVIVFSLLTDAELSSRPGIKGAKISLFPAGTQALEIDANGSRPRVSTSVATRSIKSRDGSEAGRLRVEHHASHEHLAKRSALFFAAAAVLLFVVLFAACAMRGQRT